MVAHTLPQGNYIKNLCLTSIMYNFWLFHQKNNSLYPQMFFVSCWRDGLKIKQTFLNW